MRYSSATAICLTLASALTPGRAETTPNPLRPRITINTSRTANLVHWVDNLAGTSVGKTRQVYQSYWQKRFGPMTTEEAGALESFARIRRKNVPMPPTRVSNESGCLPERVPSLTWHQIFLAEAMKAASVDDLAEALSAYLGERDRAELIADLGVFRPKFDRVWRDLHHVQRFERRFRKFLAKGALLDYLGTVAGFLGVDPRGGPSMKISLIGLPSNGSTHAEADGEYLLVEIRPLDRPVNQIQVVAHEATHFLMRLMSPEQLDRLARQAYEEAPAGPLAWRYLWEGLPTALGQGLAEVRVGSGSISLADKWYHIDAIDRFAKMIYPAVADASKRSQRIGDGLIPEITRSLQASHLFREAPTAQFLTPGFFATGKGLEEGMKMLRRRLGLGSGIPWVSVDLGNPGAEHWIQRYSCMGGIALVSPSELGQAAALDGSSLLPPGLVEAARDKAEESLGVIVTGRRKGGGTVYFLVSPSRQSVPRLVEAFARMRGVPEGPIVLTEASRKGPTGSP